MIDGSQQLIIVRTPRAGIPKFPFLKTRMGFGFVRHQGATNIIDNKKMLS